MVTRLDGHKAPHSAGLLPTFREEIRAAREAAGLTQTELADMVHVALNGWTL